MEVPMKRLSGFIALVAFLSFGAMSTLAFAEDDKKGEDKGGKMVVYGDDKKDENKDKGGHVVVFGDDDDKKDKDGK
jgi:hypothetical protein